MKKIHTFVALIKNYKFRSMFTNYFFGICSVALIILAVYGAIIFNLYKNTTEIELSRLSEKVLAKTVNIYDMIVSSLAQRLYLIQEDENVVRFLNMSAEELENMSDSSMQSSIINTLFFATLDNTYINSIYIYAYKNDYIVSWTDYKPRDRFYDCEWLNDYEQAGYPYFRARVKPHMYIDSMYNVLTYIYEIRVEGNLKGLMAINLDYAAFANTINQSFEQEPDSVYIIGGDNNIIYSDDDTMVNHPIRDYPALSRIEADASRLGKTVAMQDGSIIAATTVSNYDYVVLSRVYDDNFNRYISDLLSMFMIGGVIGLLASLLLAFIVSVWLYNYILKLITVFPYPFSPNDYVSGELQYISRSIAEMIDRNKMVEKELAAQLAELKKAQSIALQTQINPHFLLNSLQYVNLDIMRKAKGDTASTRIISLLSDILRNSLNTEEYLTNVSHEIENAKKYIQILNIRSDNDYNVVWNIAPEAASFKTVRFILQPVLENCVTHGFAVSDSEKKTIIITVECEADALRIKIADNGVGMSKSALEQLRARIKESHIKENSHIGLCNVDMRIRLIFGEKYGLTIDAVDGGGAIVTITMPKVSF